MVRTEKRAGGALLLFIVGVLTMAAAVVADLAVRALAFAIWPISPTFLPLQVGSVSVFAAVLVGGGVLVYALVVRFSRHPARTFTMIALIALLLSLVPPIMLFFNPDTRALPGVTPLAASILIVLHIMDALIAIVLLTRLAPSDGGGPHTFLDTTSIGGHLMKTLVPNAEFARLASDEQITTVVAALTANGMEALVVESGAEARSCVLDLLPEGASVFTAMSRTLDTIGLSADINESSRYIPLRPQLKTLDRQAQGREWRRLQSSPEYVVGSVHAMTEQGQVLIASASGSQLASYVFGASHVIWVVGAQKIVRDLGQGFRRVREYSYPLEHERIQALGMPGSSVSKILLVERERPGRISVLLVKEALGF